MSEQEQALLMTLIEKSKKENTHLEKKKQPLAPQTTTLPQTTSQPKQSQNPATKTKSKNQVIESLFAKFGFERLTTIQSKASPLILQKRDCLVVAPTGSGKTECSVIPIFTIVSESLQKTKHDGIQILYITPLRALNKDVFRRITTYAKNCNLTIGIRHGDTPQSQRKKITENPPDILITTPETLVVLLSQPKMLLPLASLQWVVIDEVHEMLSNKRGSQLSLSLERLELNARHPLTRIGLSATVGNISDAAKFVSGTNRPCRVIQDRTLRQYDVDIVYESGSISDIARAIYDRIKEYNLDSPVLLFTNTRGEAEFLASVLKEIATTPVELHHGSLSKSVREDTEHLLREGTGLRIIVCTSSLELGIDIGSVELVVHYGSPRQVSKFIQRIGRSRHNRDSARGLIITNSADDELEAMSILERIHNGSIEQQHLHFNALDVLAHHMIGLSIQAGSHKIKINAALDMIKKAYPYHNLELETFSQVLEQLDQSRLIIYDRENMTFIKSGRYITYHFENLSTIPDMLRFKVFDTVGRKRMGTLDQRFVGDHGEQGNIFVLRGSQWRILHVDEKSFTVNVEPLGPHMSGAASKTVPYWEGETMPIDYKTAYRVGELRGLIKDGKVTAQNHVFDEITFDIPLMDEHNAKHNHTVHNNTNYDSTDQKSTDQNYINNGNSSIIVESQKLQGIIILHCCFGSRINATLAILLSSMLSALSNSRVDSRSDGYRIVLSSSSIRISELLLLRLLQDDYDLPKVIGTSLVGTHNLNWRVWCAAKKFGATRRGDMYERRFARFLYNQYVNTPIVKEALRELFHDKYDLDGCQMILDRIKNGQILVHWNEATDGFSKLAVPILDHTSRYYSSPAVLDKRILDSIKNRITHTKHRMICMRCGKWERIVETCDIIGKLKCPHCRSGQITASYYSDINLSGIIRKRVGGIKITLEEKKKFDRAWKVASLVESFGKVAVMVISGHGIGADTATRILRNMISDDEDNLFKQIYEAERQYVTTRGFWD